MSKLLKFKTYIVKSKTIQELMQYVGNYHTVELSELLCLLSTKFYIAHIQIIKLLIFKFKEEILTKLTPLHLSVLIEKCTILDARQIGNIPTSSQGEIYLKSSKRAKKLLKRVLNMEFILGDFIKQMGNLPTFGYVPWTINKKQNFTNSFAIWRDYINTYALMPMDSMIVVDGKGRVVGAISCQDILINKDKESPIMPYVYHIQVTKLGEEIPLERTIKDREKDVVISMNLRPIFLLSDSSISYMNAMKKEGHIKSLTGHMNEKTGLLNYSCSVAMVLVPSIFTSLISNTILAKTYHEYPSIVAIHPAVAAITGGYAIHILTETLTGNKYSIFRIKSFVVIYSILSIVFYTSLVILRKGLGVHILENRTGTALITLICSMFLGKIVGTCAPEFSKNSGPLILSLMDLSTAVIIAIVCKITLT